MHQTEPPASDQVISRFSRRTLFTVLWSSTMLDIFADCMQYSGIEGRNGGQRQRQHTKERVCSTHLTDGQSHRDNHTDVPPTSCATLCMLCYLAPCATVICISLQSHVDSTQDVRSVVNGLIVSDVVPATDYWKARR